MDLSQIEQKIGDSKLLTSSQKQLLLEWLPSMPEDKLSKLHTLLLQEEAVDWEKEDKILSRAFADLKSFRKESLPKLSEKFMEHKLSSL